MKISGIGWADFSGGGCPELNFITGCTKVSEGCHFCYAEAIYKRFKMDFSKVTVHPDKLRRLARKKFPEFSPKRGKPYRPMAFVCDTSDLFHDDVPPKFVFGALDMMYERNDVIWQILTKRAWEMRSDITSWQFFLHKRLEDANHIHLGVSVSNQRTADGRIPILLDTPAAVRFVSIEPMLSAIDIENYLPLEYYVSCMETPDGSGVMFREGLDWFVVGAESGPNRRLFDVAWAADILHQCQEANIPCFLKQDSALYPGKPLIVDGKEWKEWPND